LKILLAEDNKKLRQSLLNFLTKMSFEVFEANDGQEALNLICEVKDIDVIISDIKMPNMDGIELLREVRNIDKTIKFIIVTGYSDVDTAIEATRHNAYDYVKKPYDLERIYNILIKIQEEKLLRKELKRKETLLYEYQKMSSLGILAAGIMHEINNPNAFIKGNAKFILDKFLPILKKSDVFEKLLENNIKYEDIKICLQGIINGSNRISQIVNKISYFSNDFSKINNTFTIKQCIEKSLNLLKNKIINIEIKKEISYEVIEKKCCEKMMQVYLNLIDNAIDAVQGSFLPTVIIKVSEKDSKFKVVIEDNGSGISDDFKKHIFEPFATTKPSKSGGRGLGLYIVYEIIKSLNGIITFESKLNLGTRFIVELPISEEN
jgi:signal transduction histidine kinase